MKKLYLALVFMLAFIATSFTTFAVGEQYTSDLCTDLTKASASSGWGDRQASRAFDNANTHYEIDAWESLTTGQTEWVKYDFTTPKIISKYTMANSNTTLSTPLTWIFQGSNDDSTWVNLHTVTNAPSWSNFEKREYVISNSNSYRYYRIFINEVQGGSSYYRVIGELEMMEQVATPAPSAPTNLTVAAGNAKVDLSWTAVTGATGYNVKRATTAGGPYTTIVPSVVGATYADTTVKNGTAYYYVVSSINANGESVNSSEVSATPKAPAVTLDITSIDTAKVGYEIVADVVIHNANNICAEDIRINYDTNLLEYIGAVNADGMKIYSETDLTNGGRRYITASLGKANAANGDKILLKLKFKAKAVGQAKIDITSGRIADNATLEADVATENCGEKIITIETTKDVNRTGEFTLLDLGIDAWYFGDVASATDTTKYDADVVVNNTIDDGDLSDIVSEMLKNTNYTANK